MPVSEVCISAFNISCDIWSWKHYDSTFLATHGLKMSAIHCIWLHLIKSVFLHLFLFLMMNSVTWQCPDNAGFLWEKSTLIRCGPAHCTIGNIQVLIWIITSAESVLISCQGGSSDKRPRVVLLTPVSPLCWYSDACHGVSVFSWSKEEVNGSWL